MKGTVGHTVRKHRMSHSGLRAPSPRQLQTDEQAGIRAFAPEPCLLLSVMSPVIVRCATVPVPGGG